MSAEYQAIVRGSNFEEGILCTVDLVSDSDIAFI